LIGHVFTILVPDEDRVAIDEMMLALKSTKRPYMHEHRVVNGQGELRWNQWTNSAILDERGKLLEFQAVGRDITERKNKDQELSRLTDELLRTQDEERRRLARELHDTTAQKLSALSMNLSYAVSHSDALAGKAVAALHDSLNLADLCAQEIRTLSYLLHPPELDLFGLRGAINEFVEGFSRRSGIVVHFEVSHSFERLPEDVETA
jgi:signal transduction histidine kinase